MDKPSFKLVGAPCGQHGQYTFYKALRITGKTERIIAIGDFFFVRIWQDSELVSVGELQLLWTDRVSDQTLVSLRLYFLPENTPDGRSQHGQDEVLAINDKVVLRAEDLLSWVCDGAAWEWGLRAVWRGACAPPAHVRRTQPLQRARLDFSDVEREKSALDEDADCPGVVVFSYPRYCRYRALLARLEGLQGDWLRDSLVAALGGYAAPTRNTRILYCKDTFEYPELEGHEFVCNQLAPRLKGRPRGRRRRRASRHEPDGSSDSEERRAPSPTPRRLSLRNGAPKYSDDEEKEQTSEDRAFLQQLKQFHRERKEPFKLAHSLKDLSLRSLYLSVSGAGGYEAACRHKLWRQIHAPQPNTARRHYERFLLPLERHEARSFLRPRLGGKLDAAAPIELPDSPRSPSPARDCSLTSGPAEELNREFLDSLPQEDTKLKINVKSVEKLLENTKEEPREGARAEREPPPGPTDSTNFLSVSPPQDSVSSNALSSLSSLVNGHALPKEQSRPAGRSSLRAVRVKPARSAPAAPASTPPMPLLRSPGGSPPGAGGAPLTNFGIHHPPHHSDEEVVEVPYRPKTPEIIDLDEYPESPQGVKRKKLDILKERGLEVTALPPPWPAPVLLPAPALLPAPMFHMYNLLPPGYANGAQPPKVIQATSAYGSSGPERTVYGNPKDPFMPPPHVLMGVPMRPPRNAPSATPPRDILDLTCRPVSPPAQKPAVEIVRIPSASPSKPTQNLAKNYTLVDGKAVVGSNLEITLVNPKTPSKSKAMQKRSSNGKFISGKTPPPKDYPKYTSPKKPPIVVPNYQVNPRDEVSPTSSTGSRDSQTNMLQNSLMQNPFKAQNSLQQMMDMQKSVPSMPFMDPMYMSALYSSLAGSMDQRQLAMYRDLMANQFRGYSLLGVTPTTKN